MKKTLGTLLALALIGGVAACGDDDGGEAASNDNGAAASDGECTDLSGVKVGVPYDLTGAAASAAGLPASEGTKLALEHLYEDGILPEGSVELLFEDAESSADNYVRAVTKLARQDRVSAITGFSLTGGALAAGPVAEEASIPVVSASTVGPGVGELGPHWYRMALQDDYLYSGTLPALIDLLDVDGKSVGALYQSDASAHVGSNEHFKDAFEGAGATYEAESMTENDTDYTPQLTRLRGDGLDVLIINANAGLEPQMGTQARQLGIDAQVVGNIGLAGREVIERADGAFDGAVFASPYFAGVDNELNKRFAESFEAEHGTPPDVFSAFGYEAMRFLGIAISEACSGDPAEILAAIETLAAEPFDSIFGQVEFDDEGNARWEGQVVAIDGDEYVLAEEYLNR